MLTSPKVKYKTRYIFLRLSKSIFSTKKISFWYKIYVIGAFIYENLDFSNVLYQNRFFGAGRSRAFISGAGTGAEIFTWIRSRKKYIWSRSRGKMARLRNTADKK